MEWLSAWAVALAAILALYLFLDSRYGFFRRQNVPYLRPLPIFGNFLPVALQRVSFHDLVADFYRRTEGHRCAGLFSFMKPVLMLRDPEVIKQITVKDFDHFTDHNSVVSEDVDPLFANNLFSLRGQKWRDMRHTLSPAFTASKMKNMFVLISDIGKQMVDHIKGKMETGELEDKVLRLELKDLFNRVANDVVATSAFGISIDSLKNPDNDFFAMGKEVTNFGSKRMGVLMGYLLAPKIMKMFKVTVMGREAETFFGSLVHETITTREKLGIVRPDMIHLLMLARKGELEYETAEKKANLTESDIASQAMIFFFAGFETVANLMCFAAYLLALNTDVQEKLRKEVDQVAEDTNNDVKYDDIQNMKYLDMVVSETLRLIPPVAAVDRICVDSYELPASEDGEPSVKLRKGDLVWIPIYGLHKDPNNFPDPERFDPERFSEENKQNIKPFTYMPFGSGPRFCIAQRFALMEAKVILFYLLANFKVQVVKETPIPLKLSTKGFNVNVDGGMWLGLSNR